MSAPSGVSYNDTEGAAPQALGHSIYDDGSSSNMSAQSGPAAVASFLANQFGRK